MKRENIQVNGEDPHPQLLIWELSRFGGKGGVTLYLLSSRHKVQIKCSIIEVDM